MPALITDTGQHAATQGTVGRIEGRLARPGQRAGPRPAITAGGGLAIRGCGIESVPCHGLGKPMVRLMTEAQALIKWFGAAWVLAGVDLLAGNGKTLALLEPSEGPRGTT